MAQRANGLLDAPHLAARASAGRVGGTQAIEHRAADALGEIAAEFAFQVFPGGLQPREQQADIAVLHWVVEFGARRQLAHQRLCHRAHQRFVALDELLAFLVG